MSKEKLFCKTFHQVFLKMTIKNVVIPILHALCHQLICICTCMLCSYLYHLKLFTITNAFSLCHSLLVHLPYSVKDTESKILTFMPGEAGITVQVWYDGHIQRCPAFLLYSSCMIDIQYFPFDTQKCPITVSTWSYTNHRVGVPALRVVDST